MINGGKITVDMVSISKCRSIPLRFPYFQNQNYYSLASDVLHQASCVLVFCIFPRRWNHGPPLERVGKSHLAMFFKRMWPKIGIHKIVWFVSVSLKGYFKKLNSREKKQKTKVVNRLISCTRDRIPMILISSQRLSWAAWGEVALVCFPWKIHENWVVAKWRF